MRRHFQAIIIAIGLSMTAGCAAVDLAPCSGERMVTTELYFGLSAPGGGSIGKAQWRRFLDEHVVPRFAEGFTVVDGEGYWRGEDAKRTIRENSKVLIRVHKGTAEDDREISEIIEAYKARFSQESVLRSDERSCVTF